MESKPDPGAGQPACRPLDPRLQSVEWRVEPRCPRCGAPVLMPYGFDATEDFADLCYDCERVLHPRNGECLHPRRVATTSYWMGCRCDYCVAVNAAYHRRQYLRRR